MYLVDNKLTSSIQDWLNAPSEKRDIVKGAEMMLALNRNRPLFNSILRNPVKFTPKLEYELRKYLKMRMLNLSVADVARIEETVMPKAEETVSMLGNTDCMPVVSSDDELPSGSKGKRTDHASLPLEVQKLWDENISRGRKIVVLFNECKAMSDAMPCDRFEKVRMLGILDRDYRMAMSKYDSYVQGTPFSGFSETPSEDSAKAVNSARKTISTYKNKLSSPGFDEAKRSAYIEKIEEASRIVLANGGTFTPEYAEELRSMGAYIPKP